MKILITGCLGFIGSKLTKQLVRLGHNVIGIDNIRFEQKLNDYDFIEDIIFVNEDITSFDKIKDHYLEADVIFPLACLVGAPLCDKFPEEAREVNYNAISKMLSSISHDTKVIFPTTNSGYGTKTNDLHCDETTPLEPISLYGETKVNAERDVVEFGGVAFRLATVFGTSYRTRFDLLVNDFTKTALRENRLEIFEGHFIRNYVHIDDVVSAFIFAIDNYEKLKGESYNLGLDSANISKIDLAKRIKKFVPNLEIIENEFSKDPDKRNYIVSNRKLSLKGFAAKTELEEGIKEIISFLESDCGEYSNV